ncbi:unnamed protein product [Trifolium pratense]|uniref:Uncharacterized protein n=1 Tax=Trifolium pratense TaxID=57577 RepID=A0ACB0L210_TRIPR|nr:unnamed protein product [Trifolium pratense]
MNLGQVHMNGGDGETSYANNSFLQEKVISLTKSIREEAITSLFSETLPRSIAIADLGCSCGPNTLSVLSEIIIFVEKFCQELNCSSTEYKIFFNDLSGNDFNSVFKSLDNFKVKLLDEIIKTEMGPCYFFGVPGSFYGRIFPGRSLDFVHSSYSLHWLSKVPEGLDNKGHIYISNTSPSNVVKAYYKQFQKDLSIFLKCRAEELVEGGRMVLTILGRRNNDPCDTEYLCDDWEVLATALNDMVLQGFIKEDQVNNFNIPHYYPSPYEVELEVLNEGSFVINRIELFETDLSASSDKSDFDSESKMSRLFLCDKIGYNFARCMRAFVEPLLVSHFGEAIIEDIFNRYLEILIDQKPKERKNYVNVTISLTRKG